MEPQLDPFQLIRDDLKDIKDNQKEMRTELSVKFGTIHKRIDDVVETRHQCELACKERDVDLEKKMWKTSGVMAGIITFLFELGKLIISKLIK